MRKSLLPILLAFAASCLLAQDDRFTVPDTLTFKDGRMMHGLIINNTRDAVTIQCEFEECTFPKSNILRIDDAVDALYTEAGRTGDLPSWRVIANDLRSHDQIKSLEEIPATLIDVGVFKNVPYKSFRVNHDIELNIYGDPNDPAGIELGIYGSRAGDDKLRKTLRGYLAGFLSTRREISTLYRLGLKEGLAQVGSLTIEVTPPNAPDAYGAWWISLYNEKDLAGARLNDREYALLARPMSEVVGKDGRVLPNAWDGHSGDLMKRKDGMVLKRGFYRDENGNFRLLPGSVMQ